MRFGHLRFGEPWTWKFSTRTSALDDGLAAGFAALPFLGGEAIAARWRVSRLKDCARPHNGGRSRWTAPRSLRSRSRPKPRRVAGAAARFLRGFNPRART